MSLAGTEGCSHGVSRVEYRQVYACPGNSPDGPNVPCRGAFDACTGGLALATTYTRTDAGPWTPGDTLCLNPIAAQGPAVTPALVRAEFLKLPFATPTTTLQPPDHHSLIGLPVYLAITWPTGGLGPGAQRTLTLLGQPVDLRITLVAYRYDYGDGTTLGPTTSPGGPWPDGDIHHAYTHPGTYRPVLTTTLTADYRLDGGPWQPIDGTATLTTPFPPVTVHEATNELLP